MPTIKVVKLDLFEQIGRTYTDEGFDELCFQFGIELDEVTSEAVMQRKEKGDRDASVSESKAEEIIYKIDVPANRYDLLCVEGIARALKIFIGGMEPPRFVALPAPSSGRLEMHVTAAVASIRPVVVCACLRGITFSRASYNSFIELQVPCPQPSCIMHLTTRTGQTPHELVQAAHACQHRHARHGHGERAVHVRRAGAGRHCVRTAQQQ
jgi:phenylalanyl-tRNA synthetase beta chain